MSEILITYTNLPQELIVDLQNKFASDDLVCHIEHKTDFTELGDCFVDMHVADTIIYIRQHLSELIATGLLTPAVYDLLKSSIQYCWRKLCSHLKQRQSVANTFCEINFKMTENTNICFQLNGNIEDSNIINNAVEKMFEYLKEKKLQERDSLLHRKKITDTNDTIDLELNVQTQKWEYRPSPNSLRLFTEPEDTHI